MSIQRIGFLLQVAAFGAVCACAAPVVSVSPVGESDLARVDASGVRETSVLQRSFDGGGIWTRVGAAKRAAGGRVSFFAPTIPGAAVRYRVADRQATQPGDLLFARRGVSTLHLWIGAAEKKALLKNLPKVSPPPPPGGGMDGGDNGGGIDPGGGVVGPGGEVVGPDDPLVEDPGDTGDFGNPPANFNPAPAYDYVPVVMRWNSGTKGRVGLRLKGNSSLVSAVVEGRKNFPFKIDLNRYKSGQSLDGLRKFNLHPVISKAPLSTSAALAGETGLEEYLSYGAFREFGVPACRTAWVRLFVNDEDYGMYGLIEQMDRTFMRRHFDAGDGAVYKPETYSGTLEWKGSNYAAYQDLHYKGGSDDSHRSILRFLDTINHQPVARFPEVIDVQSVFNYVAGNVALGNWDTYDALGHNYVLYEGRPGRFYMLPWDMNLSQAPGSLTLYGDMAAEGGDITPEPRPLTDNLYRPAGQDARYRATLAAFLRGPGSEVRLNARIDEAVGVLGGALHPDAVLALRANIRTRVAELNHLLETTPAPAP